MKTYRTATIGLALALITGAWQGTLASGYRMKIEFPGYTNRTETLTNFPVLVVFSNNVGGSGFSFETTPFLSDDGFDLRFRDSGDTTDLNYEIELWDTNDACYVWVQVDEMPTNGSGSIWANWGLDPTQQSCTTNGAVWSQGYALVMHMAEASGSAVEDATAWDRTATVSGTWTWQVDGPIGQALQLHGNLDDLITLDQADEIDVSDSSFCIDAWFKNLQGTQSWRTLARGDDGDHLLIVETGKHELGMYKQLTGELGFNGCGYDLNPAADVWHHIAVVGTGSESRYFVNGSYVGSTDEVANHNITWLGNHQFGQKFSEYLDEYRIATVSRSDDWIRACYLTVASNDVFASYGTVQIPDSDAPFISSLSASGLATNQATLNGRLISTGATETAVSVFWEATDTDQGTNTTAWAHTNAFGAYTLSSNNLPYAYATNITGLASDTTYTYRYYATNDAGEAWGDARSFTTWQTPSIPTINMPSETGFVHVVISGAVTGGNPDPQAWFCLNAGADGPSGTTSGWDIVESAGLQSGAFTNTITDLSDDTLYYARVYVTNAAGEAWSSDINFTTETTPAQLTLDQDRQIDGNSPFLSFEETPVSLSGSGTKPNWLYDFSYYGTNPVPVDLSSNTLYSADSSSRGTITLDLNSGNLSGTGETAVITRPANNANAHHVTITNVGIITMGGIDTRTIRTSGSPYAYAGNVKLYSAGSVRTESILTGSVNSDNRGGPGNVTLVAAGNVFIESADGSVLGLIDASAWTRQTGTIYVKHVGHFRSAGLRNYVVSQWSGVNISLSDITMDGTDASGDFVTGDIDSDYKGSNYGGGTRKTITIRNYNDVSTGVISSRHSGTGGYANNVNISENITGDILIAGEVDLHHATVSRRGSLTLACDGSITLAELDLGKVLHARLSSGSGYSTIEDAIVGFDTTTGLTGSGTESDPYTTSETRLRAPAGQAVYYSYTPGTLNDALGGDVWQLKALDGTSDGGLLMLAPVPGTLLIFR